MNERFSCFLLMVGAVSIPLFFLPFTPEDPFLVPKQFLLSFLACCISIAAIYPVEDLMKDSLRSLVFASLFFLLCLAVSIPHSTNYHLAVDELKRWMYLLILFFAATRINWSLSRLRLLIRTSIIISTIVSVSALLEHFGLVPFYMYPFDKEELYSFFGSANILAQYMVFPILWGVGFIFTSENFRSRVMGMGCTSLSVTALLITLSRGAIISIVSGVIIFSVLYLKAKCFDQHEKRYFKLIMVLFISVLAAVIFASNAANDGKEFNRIIMEFKRGDSGRFPIWKDAVHTIISSPLTGVGIGNYSLSYVGNAHNELLQMGAESGIIGVSGFLVFLILVLKRFRQQYYSRDTSEIKIIHLAIFSSCFAALMHSIVDYNLHSAASSYFFFIGLGILCTNISNKNVERILSKKIIIRNSIFLSLTIFLSLLALHAEYKKIISHYLHSQAIYSLKEKDITVSLNYSLKSIQYQPYSSKYHKLTGRLYAITGQLELARSHLRKAQMLSVVTRYRRTTN